MASFLVDDPPTPTLNEALTKLYFGRKNCLHATIGLWCDRVCMRGANCVCFDGKEITRNNLLKGFSLRVLRLVSESTISLSFVYLKHERTVHTVYLVLVRAISYRFLNLYWS